jgi:uncharacterized LabA/DUF88 family protein
MRKKENNHAFIDGQNLYKGTEHLSWDLDYEKFRIHLMETYGSERVLLFLGYLEKQEPLYTYLRTCGFDLVFKEVAHDGMGKPKGNVDVLMTLHALLELDGYEKAILVTSDGDFAPLVEHLLKVNKLRAVISPEYETCSWLLRKYARGRVDYLSNSRNKLQKMKKRP